jgi:hypothetical protein
MARLETVMADIRRGWGASLEEIAIAALVVLPFSGTLAILLQFMGLPAAVAIVVAGLAQGAGTFGTAGWRARTSAEGGGDGE